MIPKHEKLVDDLLIKTESGDVEWEPTDAENQFVLKLKKGAILLEKSRDLFGLAHFVITILNHEGIEVDRVEVRGGDHFPMVSNLFRIIERRVNRIDEQIDEIIEELETL